MACSVCAGHDTYNCPCCGEEIRMIDCPDCNGTGKGGWKVWDIIDRVVVDCEEIAYLASPEDEDEAAYMGKRYCRYSDKCPTCHGEGQILNRAII